MDVAFSEEVASNLRAFPNRPSRPSSATTEKYALTAPASLMVASFFEVTPSALAAVSFTVYSPDDAYSWVGLASLDVSPSPKSHLYPTASVDLLVKDTLRPSTEYSNSATGAFASPPSSFGLSSGVQATTANAAATASIERIFFMIFE